MSRPEIAERAARYIELSGCTQDAASKRLNISPATLSRAFGDERIPPNLMPRAERLKLSTRSLIAAMPESLMEPALAYAENPGPDGRVPTRDQVSQHLRELRKGGRTKPCQPKTVTLRFNGRSVTLTIGDRDSANTVAEDFKGLVAKLGKHAEVPPDGWPFLFK